MSNGKEYQILKLAKERGAITRQQISQFLKVSLSQASTLTKKLLQERLLREAGYRRSEGGRRAILLELNPDLVYGLGVEVSSRAIKAALVNLRGEVIRSAAADPKVIGNKTRMISAIEDTIAEVLAQDKSLPLAGIGVGIAGIVSSDRKTSVEFPHLEEWRRVPLAQILAEKFSCQVLLENQVRAAALAELRYGKGKEFKNFLYLYIGRGIGLGIVLDSRVYAGAANEAGEFGHIVVEEKGPVCYCGNYGCLESLASPPALEAQYREGVEKGVNSYLAGNHAGKKKEITLENIFLAAREGEKLANNLLENGGRFIGEALANLINLLNPRAVIFAGILTSFENPFLGSICRAINSRLLSDRQSFTKLELSTLADKASSLGGASLIFDDLFSKAELVSTLRKKGK